MARSIQFFKIQLLFSDIHCIHTTANIHTYHIGNRLIRNRHSRANGTAFSCVHIRHNPNFTVFCKIIVTHSADLLNGLFLHNFCKTQGSIHFPFDFKHIPHPFICSQITFFCVNPVYEIQQKLQKHPFCCHIEKPPISYKISGSKTPCTISVHFPPLFLGVSIGSIIPQIQ